MVVPFVVEGMLDFLRPICSDRGFPGIELTSDGVRDFFGFLRVLRGARMLGVGGLGFCCATLFWGFVHPPTFVAFDGCISRGEFSGGTFVFSSSSFA